MEKICILGVGGAADDILSVLSALEQVHLAVLNTDENALRNSSVTTKLLLGPKTCGGKSANVPLRGKRAAEESRNEIHSLIKGVSTLILTGGLGGGAASGAIPVIAGIGKSLGIAVHVAVTLPFSFESERRLVAKDALEELRSMGVSTFTYDFAEIETDVASLSMPALLARGAQIIAEEIKRNFLENTPLNQASCVEEL